MLTNLPKFYNMPLFFFYSSLKEKGGKRGKEGGKEEGGKKKERGELGWGKKERERE